MSEFSKTKYLEQKLLNHTLLGEEYTPPDQLYLALFTADPGRLGSTAGEIPDPDYDRQLIAFTAATDDPTSGSYCQSVLSIDYPQATIDWGYVTHGAIMDAKTGGNMLYKGPFDVAKQILTGDYYQIPAGEVKVVED